jgi:F-type H+-transporting ATPase subunit b
MKDTTFHETKHVEAGGGNPLLRLDPGMVIWTWMVFILLLIILSKFAWRPLMKMLDDREKNVRKALDDIDLAKVTMIDAEKGASRIMAEVEEKSIDIINRARESAQTLAMEINTRALEESEKIIANTKLVINAEREKAVASLRRETATLAVAVAEKLIRTNLDDDKNTALTEKYIEEMVGVK